MYIVALPLNYIVPEGSYPARHMRVLTLHTMSDISRTIGHKGQRKRNISSSLRSQVTGYVLKLGDNCTYHIPRPDPRFEKSYM